MRFHQQFVFIIFLLPVIGLASSATEYSQGVKLGNIPKDVAVKGLVASGEYVDRLYTVHETQVLVLSKDSAQILAIVPAKSKTDDDASWDTIASGPCDRDNTANCLYLVKHSHTGVQLLKLSEPILNDTTGDFPAVEEHLSIELPSLSTQSSLDSLYLLVNKQGDLYILRLEDNEIYFSYQVTSEQWTEESSSLKLPSSSTKIELQQKMLLKDIDWNEESSRLIVQSDEGYVYVFHGHDSQKITDTLMGKPHHLKLKLPTDHSLKFLCWDASIQNLYSIVQGKHTSLFSFKQASSALNYQSDQARGSDRQTSRPSSECVDKKAKCTQWASNKVVNMCTSMKSYMTKYCPKSCGTCRESVRLKAMASCTDYNQMCAGWAEEGRCQNAESKAFMMQSCKLSCKVCPGVHSSPTRCQDMNQHCSIRARRGECERRPDIMDKECKVSCKKCPTDIKTSESYPNDQGSSVSGSSTCKDMLRYCARWASDGKCSSEHGKDYMFTNCPSSCGLCGSQDNRDSQQAETCKDKNAFCLVWASQGYNCNTGYMLRNCRMACQKCHKSSNVQPKPECADRENYCQTWSKYGMCTLKPTVMKESCPASCGRCKNGTEDESINRILYTTRPRPSPTTTERPVTESRASRQCADRRSDCSRYAQAGYCRRARDYMAIHCQRTCNLCVTSTTTQTPRYSRTYAQRTYSSAKPPRQRSSRPTVQRESAVKDSCADDREYCKTWAAAGLCSTRSEIMHSLCPVSCNICTVKSKCADLNQNCGAWATAERCRLYMGYMRTNCAKSCNMCHVEEESTPECVDEHRSCGRWAANQYCERNRAYMGRKCKKSCSLC